MSWEEFIELRDLRSTKEQIELTGTHAPCSPPRLERTNALRISPGRVPDLLSRVGIIRVLSSSQDPQLTEEKGEGHDFQPCSHAQPTWCDLCGDFIWGLYKQSLRCVNCKFTCHYRCRALIQLDCSWERGSLADPTCVVEHTIETDTNVDEQIELSKQELTVVDIQQKVKEYNAQINSNLFMNMNKDGSYTGFIKVQFKLARPVSVPTPKKGGNDTGGRRASGVKRRTSFYLPKDASKHLHISSRTSAREVIEALLKKFTVVDNPAKFALFERSERHDQVYIRKLSDTERPLRLRLCAGPNEKVLSFVLKENETGEVNWHAFSMPELKNFLRILQREEEEHIKQIVQRYALARTKMQEALAGSTPG
ncbi:ras association domain-containing protein 1-like isoform X1 [Neolamprologus brichardi]|uniref:Ras association domain family member 1 n=1 Tax=Neolamprologus brichardi TaxID=32507 RepID=A0A3Q4I642_NEOBR|nr:ras association domain-containing protein 1-like isoform X1 [Neolamprologus brichardi]XP_006783243.1 ras association domain-containing protein 1-like isoform X1 [Neolamprologus brichardi]XP_035760406.1 ras association domain-containing protein 1-like isoform X1 [Neolamprologus brichardi]